MLRTINIKTRLLISCICLFFLLSATLFSQEQAASNSDAGKKKADNIPVRLADKEVKSVPEKPAEPEEERLFRKDVILRINELLKKVQHYYPTLAEKLTDSDKDAILKSLVNALDCGMEYRSGGQVLKSENKNPNSKDAAPFPAPEPA